MSVWILKLEEMKSKDHMLALMDPNQYPDKSNNIKQMLAVQSIQDLMTASKEIDSWEHKIPKKGEGTDSNCAASLFPNINLVSILLIFFRMHTPRGATGVEKMVGTMV